MSDKKKKKNKEKFKPDESVINKIKERISEIVKSTDMPFSTSIGSYADMGSRGHKDGMVVVGPHGKVSFAIPLGATTEQKEIFRILMDALRKSSDAEAMHEPAESNIDFDDFDSFTKKKKEEKPQ